MSVTRYPPNAVVLDLNHLSDAQRDEMRVALDAAEAGATEYAVVEVPIPVVPMAAGLRRVIANVWDLTDKPLGGATWTLEYDGANFSAIVEAGEFNGGVTAKTCMSMLAAMDDCGEDRIGLIDAEGYRVCTECEETRLTDDEAYECERCAEAYA